jgi:hypothetical protein
MITLLEILGINWVDTLTKEPKGNLYSYARICVEVDLEKGLLEALQINIDGWSHQHILDYEHIPFKCHICHEYGHFAKSYSKAQEEQPSSQQKTRMNSILKWSQESSKKSQRKGSSQPRKPHESLNQFKVLGNIDLEDMMKEPKKEEMIPLQDQCTLIISIDPSLAE